MKKTGIWILCLVLTMFLGMFQPAAAAGSAHMSLNSSSATVHRGDSFTVTVSLSNDQPVSNGGIMLSYDSSVFEFLGGSCHVSNTALAEVSPANGGGVFVLQADAVVSGTIFTLNLRVRENAAIGSYKISGSPSLSVPCTIGGTTVTVACAHDFANPTKKDGENHVSTCTICGEKKTEAHSWNSGKVTKEPTCKTTGVKKLTCTVCNATKEETIPVSNDHKYGSWGTNGTSGHSRTCSVCGKKDTASHTWNNGTVLQEATCQDTGSKKVKCTACGETKTETIAKAEHSYGESTYVDEQFHTHTCKDCGLETKEMHKYPETWEHDENWHSLRCEGCGHEKDQAAHVPGPKATETTDQVCTVCNRILQPMGEHVHTFRSKWVSDSTGHWHACTDCNEKDSAGLHVYQNDCDSDCDVCGFQREPLHAAAEEWSADGEAHWLVCVNCGEKLNPEAHVPGPEATISAPQTCTVCLYELAPIVPHDHVFDAHGTEHNHNCACGEALTADRKTCPICKTFPWQYVCIAEAAVIVGLLAAMVIGKKKTPKKA